MSGFSDAAMTVGANAIKAVATHAQLHSAAAGGSGTLNVTTAARKPITWGSTTGAGDFGLGAQLDFTGGAANGPVYSVTLWSQLATGGTFYGEFLNTGDPTFNAIGEFSVISLTEDGSSS